MKRSLLSFILNLCLAGVAMTAWSQNLMLSQEEPEDEIAVVGYFCNNDTMTYARTTSKYKIVEGDTTTTNYFQEVFMFVVTDSTSKGYKMKLIPLDVRFKGADDDEDEGDNFMVKALSQTLGKIVCEFTTDELGQVQRIDNWRTIRDEVKKGIKLMCDTLYTTDPGMDSIMPRKQLENLLQLRFSTEQGVRESYEELDELFGLHGSTFDVGELETDSDDGGYPTHIRARVGYTTIEDEENDFEGDYAISTQSTATMPVEDLMDIGFGAVSLLLSDMVNDSLEVVRDQVLDSLKTAMPQGVEVKENAYFGYFINGWPKEYYYEKIVDIGAGKSVESTSMEWISRNWDIYVRDDESAQKKDI